MRRYRVSWIERHSARVWAEDESKAIDTAYDLEKEKSLDEQEVIEVQGERNG